MLYIFFCLSPDLLSGVLLRDRDLRLLDEFLDPVVDKRFWGMKFLSAMFFFLSFSRPVERSSFERQGSGGSWMSPVGRGYSGNERTVGQNRQGLSNSVRALEDKTSLFPNPASIGRNYDEDERKPVDGRPRSGHSAEQYEEQQVYEDRPRSGHHHNQTLNRFSSVDEHGYKSTVPVLYEQSSPPNKQNPSVSPPPYWRQPPQQQQSVASVDRNSGPNVWPARQDSESTQMPSDSVQNQSQVSVPWQAQIPKSKALDLGLSDRASSGGLKPEHSWGGASTDRVPHGNNYVNAEHSKFIRQQSWYPENSNQVGYASEVGQMDRQVVYTESYEGRPSYNDGTRPGFGDGARVGENSSVQGSAARVGYTDARGYAGDSSGRGLNDTRSFGSGEGYYDPGNRITFFDVGRTGRVENDYRREPSHPEGLRQGNSGLRAHSTGETPDNYGPAAGRGALVERNHHGLSLHESRNQRVDVDQVDRVPASMDWERRRSPPLVESRQAFNKERPFPSAEGYWVGYSPAEVSPADASGPRTPLVVPDPVAERPRLKLLPRSKPLETDEAVGHIELEVPAIEVLTALSCFCILKIRLKSV